MAAPFREGTPPTRRAALRGGSWHDRACSTGGATVQAKSAQSALLPTAFTPCRRSFLMPSSSALYAAGLFCAGQAGQRGLKVFAHRPQRPRWPRRSASRAAGAATSPTATWTCGRRTSTLWGRTRSSAARPVALHPGRLHCAGAKHGIPFHEKHKGQLFADRSAEDIIQPCCWPNARRPGDALAALQRQKIAFLASNAHESSAGSYQIDTSRAQCTPQRGGATGACPSPKSAQPTWATGWRSSSTFRWSNGAPAWCR